MSRRPRGICPVCRSTLSLTWSGDVRVLRRHSVGEQLCAGAGLPAVGELPELTRVPASATPAAAHEHEHRIASVA